MKKLLMLCVLAAFAVTACGGDDEIPATEGANEGSLGDAIKKDLEGGAASKPAE